MTIFITAYQGFISRNIFNSDVLKILRRQPDLQIVLFVPSDKKEFISHYYGGENVLVEGVDFFEPINADKFWYRLSFLLENTRYVKNQRGEQLWRHKTPAGYLNYAWLSFVALIFSNLPLARKVYRIFDFHFSPKNAFDQFIKQYRPSLIFSTDIFGAIDSLLLHNARYRGIPIVGMVRSWDNTTTKGILRIIPEKIIVNSPVLRDELIKLHSCKSRDIFVAGLPQFDTWLSGPTQSREAFFRKIGADPVKRLILFAPAGKILSDTDWQLCQILQEAIKDGSLPSNIQFLIRNHPQHPADLSKFADDPNFVIERPGSGMQPEEHKSANLSPQENDHLRNSIYYSDIIMYVATSLGLDASIFNKPQILVSFDGWESKPYIQSVKRYNREDCLAGLVKLGGTRVAENKEAWIRAINDYLQNSTLDQQGRNKAIELHLYKIDGKAGARIADFILHQPKLTT